MNWELSADGPHASAPCTCAGLRGDSSTPLATTPITAIRMLLIASLRLSSVHLADGDRRRLERPRRVAEYIGPRHARYAAERLPRRHADRGPAAPVANRSALPPARGDQSPVGPHLEQHRDRFVDRQLVEPAIAGAPGGERRQRQRQTLRPAGAPPL